MSRRPAGTSGDARGPVTPPVWRVDLRDVPRTSWGLVAAVLLAVAALNLAVNLWAFTSEPLFDVVFRPVARATWGLVRPTLLVNLVAFALVVVGLVFRVGGLAPTDVGLDRRRLGRGVAVTALVWAAIQGAGAVAQLATTGTVAVRGTWATTGAGALVGAFLAQALGNALFEEVVYRGFVLTQVVLLLGNRVAGRWQRLGVALVGSQAAFALLHVPNRIYRGLPLTAFPEDLALVFLSGLLFALVYYRTGNLFAAVGVHALGNAPLGVFADAAFASFLTEAAMVVLVVAWRPIDRGLSAAGAALGVGGRPGA